MRWSRTFGALAALREAGHDPADFKVTLMLHTFVAEDREKAREIARGPMKDYLRSAAALIKQFAWVFPAFKRPEGVSNPFELDLGNLSEDELDAILERYVEQDMSAEAVIRDGGGIPSFKGYHGFPASICSSVRL